MHNILQHASPVRFFVIRCQRHISRKSTALRADEIMPIEVWEHVIDAVMALHDRRTLIACAAVCRAWRPRCSFHLFDTVHIKTSKQLKPLRKAMAKAPHARRSIQRVSLYYEMSNEECWTQLVKCLASLSLTEQVTFSAPIACPRGAVTEPRESSRKPRNTTSQSETDEIPGYSIIQSLPLLPRSHNRRATLNQLNHITSLKFTNIAFDSNFDAFWLLSQFPNLAHLFLSHIFWVMNDVYVGPGPKESPATGTLANLRILEIEHVRCYLQEVNVLLGMAPSSLQSLSIVISDRGQSLKSPPPKLNIDRFPYLETLNLQCPCYYQHFNGNEWISNILRSVSSTLIKDICLGYRSSKDRFRFWHDFLRSNAERDRLVASLHPSRYQNLSNITFVVSALDIYPDCLQKFHVLSLLSPLGKNFIVHVELST